MSPRWSVVRFSLDGRLPPKEFETGFLFRRSAARCAARLSRKNAWLGATYEVRRR